MSGFPQMAVMVATLATEPGAGITRSCMKMVAGNCRVAHGHINL